MLVIEVLEYQTTVQDAHACVYFLQDLHVKSEDIIYYDWHHNNSYIIDENNDESHQPVVVVSSWNHPIVIDLVYNWAKRNYWLTNLKLPPPYDDDDILDGINHHHHSEWSQQQKCSKNLFVACLGRGHRMDEAYCVDIDMCVLRFKSIETDLLITLTTPISSDRVVVEEAGAREMCSNARINDDDNNTTKFSTFRQILNSFNITDWNLFETIDDADAAATKEYIIN